MSKYKCNSSLSRELSRSEEAYYWASLAPGPEKALFALSLSGATTKMCTVGGTRGLELGSLSPYKEFSMTQYVPYMRTNKLCMEDVSNSSFVKEQGPSSSSSTHRMRRSLSRLHLAVTRAYKVKPDINFEVFIHKVDGLSDENSGIEKVFLFDVVSKIYIASDSSLVDIQTYELCCDVVRDISCIYRLDPYAEKRPDKESVVKHKHNTLLRTGSHRITVHLKNQQTLSLNHSLRN
uniref:Ras-related GTP-binding protein n=1 Tax=Hucho hucho TaxID=62062 RepID=A0A4W5MBX2_9TELE